MSGLIENIFKKFIRRGLIKVEALYKRLEYSRFKPNHVFQINVNGVEFRMAFSNYRLQGSIIERIEGRREKETVAIIKSIVREGAKVLELGGCYGYFTIIISKCVGYSGKVVSIEGTPRNYEILCNNLNLNGLNNVETHNVFLTNKSEFATFALDDKHPYDAIRRLKSNSEEAEVEVRTVDLAPFLSKIDYEPDYVFMDIEGFEVEVFQSLSDSHFSKNRPVIVFEIHHAFYEKEMGLEYIVKILEKNKYIYRGIGENLICFPE